MDKREAAALESWAPVGSSARIILGSVIRALATAARVLFIKNGEVFHQIYRGTKSRQEMYKMISDTLTVLMTGGEAYA